MLGTKWAVLVELATSLRIDSIAEHDPAFRGCLQCREQRFVQTSVPDIRQPLFAFTFETLSRLAKLAF